METSIVTTAIRPTERVNILVPAGALGSGIRPEHVQYGIEAGAHAIAVDAGSTDSGPSCLATGISKMARDSVKRDLSIIVKAAWQARIPLLVGTCGTSGTNAGLNWTRDIVLEIAAELAIKPRIALLRSQQDPATLKRKRAEGKITPLPPSGPMTDDLIDACSNIVALLGPEPYIEALRSGADIVLGGRTTDTAVLAAVPLMRGAGVGPSWHAAKIAECGGLCTMNPREGGVLIRVGVDDFEVLPLNPDNRCTPQTVYAHMLYENSDPFILTEPGGILDVTDAVYTAVDDRTVRVSGSRFETKPYTMKLEGASLGPFQTIMLIGIQDPLVLGSIDAFLERMHATLSDRVKATIGAEAGDFKISLRPYGWNAVTGLPVPADAPAPREIGLLFIATAETQAMATRIAKVCNPLFFHFPAKLGVPLPSYAFPFSPAEIERGRVSEFLLNHVVATDDAFELIKAEWAGFADEERKQ